MIIGINGFAGSGKDTVGKIIQLLIRESQGREIDFNDAIDNTDTYDWWLEESSGWEIKKWAGKLKEVATLLTGIPAEKFEDQEFKKTNLGPEWDYEVQEFIEQGVYKTVKKQMTVRDLLQKLGTEGLRNGLHPNTWVNALMADYKCVWKDPDPIPGNDYRITYRENYGETSLIQYGEGSEAEVFNHEISEPNWIITDTRFENEAQAIKSHGGIVIRVNRPGIGPTNGHASEVGLEGYDFDYVITNDGTINDLVEMVREVLIQARILSR